MMDEADRSLRGARFVGTDFTSATFRECTMRGVRIVGSVVSDLHVSGFAGSIEKVVVNDVDVTAFVEAELDRRHPERVQLRAVRSAVDHRAMWASIQQLWSGTIARAERLPEDAAHQRVDEEWSLIETLRHLIFATDVWLGRMVLGGEMPFHPLGLPPTDYPAMYSVALGLEIDAQPSLRDVIDVRTERIAEVGDILGDMTDTELVEMRTAQPAPGWDEVSLSVGRCLRVIFREECEHHRFASRDLGALEARA